VKIDTLREAGTTHVNDETPTGIQVKYNNYLNASYDARLSSIKRTKQLKCISQAKT
jgi:hypothetical protein